MPDDADAKDRWPRFEMMTFSAPTGIPNGWDAELLEKGAPTGLIVDAVGKLTVLEDPSAGPLVCFGIVNPHVFVCLDPRSKQVVAIDLDKSSEIHYSNADPIISMGLVNSTLDQFIASVRMVTARFPFDSEGSVEDRGRVEPEDELARAEWLENERFQTADELLDSLRRIDPASVEDLDGFWMTFVSDVQLGDYSTEMVLGSPDVDSRVLLPR